MVYVYDIYIIESDKFRYVLKHNNNDLCISSVT